MPRHKQRVPRNERPRCPICDHTPKNLIHHLMTNHNLTPNDIASIINELEGVDDVMS